MTERFADLESLLQQRLGPTYSRETARAVRNVTDQLDREKATLDAALTEGRISGRTFATKTNLLLHEYLASLADVLGPDDYQRVFGTTPGEPLGVLDPEIAAGAYGR